MSAVAEQWGRLGIRPVINAAGKMTYLGSSAPHPDVVAAMSEAAGSYVDMADLKRAVGSRVAELVGAPAGWVTSCAAAGIAMSVAGTITGTDRAAVHSVPDQLSSRREVVLQKAHAVDFGAPLTQMLRLAGGHVREIGAVNRVEESHLRAAINDRTAAVVFVVSHHAAGGSELALDLVVALAHEAAVPVIVDAAAEVDLRRYLDAGADLVVYSGHKAIAGPTSGLVLGRADLVAACAAQEAGIGRAMKIGKESLAGLVVALERYMAGATTRSEAELLEILERVRGPIDGILPIELELVRDGTRPIPRLRMTMRTEAAFHTTELVRRLEAHEPSVRTRNHMAAQGHIDIDPRELSVADADALPRILQQVFSMKMRRA